MKIKILATAIALFTLIFTACKKDVVTTLTENPEPTGYYTKVKINGNVNEAKAPLAYTVIVEDYINIYGIFQDNKSIYLSIDKNKGVGTYQLANSNEFAYFADGQDTYFSLFTGGSCEVTITSKTAKEIKGKFKAVVTNAQNNATKTVTMTEGAFSHTY